MINDAVYTAQNFKQIYTKCKGNFLKENKTY